MPRHEIKRYKAVLFNMLREPDLNDLDDFNNELKKDLRKIKNNIKPIIPDLE